MGEGHRNSFKSPADGILELLGNLHPFSLRGIMEVVYDQDQIMFPVICYNLILGQGRKTSSALPVWMIPRYSNNLSSLSSYCSAAESAFSSYCR